MEGKVGSPEKPLSDLGKISYRSYWIEQVLTLLDEFGSDISVQSISQSTQMTEEDIVSALQEVRMVNFYRGSHVVNARPGAIKTILREARIRSQKRLVKFDPTKLKWTPPESRKEGRNQNIKNGKKKKPKRPRSRPRSGQRKKNKGKGKGKGKEGNASSSSMTPLPEPVAIGTTTTTTTSTSIPNRQQSDVGSTGRLMNAPGILSRMPSVL